MLILLGMIVYLGFLMFTDLHQMQQFLLFDEKPKQPKNQLKIALLYDQTNYPDQKLAKGAAEIAQKKNIDLKTIRVKPTDQLSLLEQYQLASLSNYDGIIVDGENRKLAPLINKAYQNNIATITIHSDLPETARISYVGLNNFQAGYKLGKKMLLNINGRKPVFAIISKEHLETGQSSMSEYLQIFGFRVAISSNPESKIRVWRKLRSNLVENLQEINRLLLDHPDIIGIFTTQPVTTEVTASILDRRKNGKEMILIGSGNTTTIRNYITHDIIDASLYNDQQLVGRNAVLEIENYLKYKKVNIFSSIDIKILTKEVLENDLDHSQ